MSVECLFSITALPWPKLAARRTCKTPSTRAAQLPSYEARWRTARTRAGGSLRTITPPRLEHDLRSG